MDPPTYQHPFNHFNEGRGDSTILYRQYWELYNEIGGSHGGVVASTFKIGLLVDSELRKSFTKNLAEDMDNLMERIGSTKGWRMISSRIRLKENQ